MKLYGSTNSGHSYKVKLFLTIAAIKHDYEWVDLALPRNDRAPKFVKISPFGEVPVLTDNNKILCQSNAILQYLSKEYNKFSGGQKADEWLFWETNRIGFSLPNYRFAKLWQKQPKDVMTYLLDRLHADLDILNQHLNHQTFLIDNKFSIADISNCAYLYWLEEIEIDVKTYPNVNAWLQLIKLQPNWQSPDILLKTSPL
ncbi:MAG: glutathione S-transferase family protein [Rhizobiales bacterium]|nr:glutathione S-transferase family protein [Hyphomicrobiales bacterium]